MGIKTDIQWTDITWNVAVGCDKVNSDCKFCYMFRGSLNGTRYVPNEVRRTKTVFKLPLKVKEPSKIFTSSLTDFFHKDIDSYREEAWDIIRKCPQHTFQILTKRPERITQCLPADWGEGYDNVWLGISAGNQENYDKMFANFFTVKSKTKFLSAEPLHGEILLHGLSDEWDFWDHVFDWVIVGGESGNDNGKYKYRPCDIRWIESIVDQCDQNASVFVKQLGTHISKQLKLSDRHGGNIDEFPEHLKIREFPQH